MRIKLKYHSFERFYEIFHAHGVGPEGGLDVGACEILFLGNKIFFIVFLLKLNLHLELFCWVGFHRDLRQYKRTLSILLDRLVVVLMGCFFRMSGVARGIAMNFKFSEEIFLILPATATVNSSLTGINCEILVETLSTLELKFADNSFF